MNAPSVSADQGRLPRGRHGLPRDKVVASQRRRMQRAIADAMVEKGYVGTSVADVIGRARVSRETFYQQYASKQDCFLDAFDAAVDLLLVGAADLLGQADDRSAVDRFACLLAAYLEALAADPAAARVFLVEVYAAGPAAMARRAEIQHRFVDVVADVLGAHAGEQRFACEALVAAISSMVTMRLAALDLDGLRGLQAPIVKLVEQAFCGPLWA